DRLVPAWVLDNVTLTLGETSARLFNMPAYTVAVDSLIERGSDCRLGLDVPSGFNGYIVNLRSMSLLPIAGASDRRLVNEPNWPGRSASAPGRHHPVGAGVCDQLTEVFVQVRRRDDGQVHARHLRAEYIELTRQERIIRHLHPAAQVRE